MSVDPTAVPSSIVQCGACSFENSGSSQFCNSCGHNLYEPCEECSKPVLLTQSFCGNCGNDLAAGIKRRQQQQQSWIVDAINRVKKDEFEEAFTLLSRVAEEKDFRLREMAADATSALEKSKKIRADRETLAREAMQQAESAILNDDHSQIIQILEPAPNRLLSDAARAALRRSKEFMANQGSISEEIRKAIEQRDWRLAGPLLNQLQELEPENEQCARLAIKVGKKLFDYAEKRQAKRNYSSAMKYLDAVPRSGQDERYMTLRTQIEDLIWLRRQFDGEPFDTPTLGRLAVRLQKDEPEDPHNAARVKAISDNLKQPNRADRTVYPYRSTAANSWMGGALGYLTALKEIRRPDLAQLRGKWGQMNVATGLALQGIGESRIEKQLAPEKGFLRKLVKRKSDVAWGVDLGSHSIKGVCLQRTEDGIEMIDGWIHPYDQPLCRPGHGTDPVGRAAEELEQIVEERDFGDVPVWINLPSSDLISRFTLFPPVTDKALKPLVEQEAEKRIPLELNELILDQWYSPFDAGDGYGRPVTITAVKKSSAEQRFDRLSVPGLNLVGMQADPLALVNLAAFEFSELLSPETENEADSETLDADAEDKTPTVALVHSGAGTTVVVLVSRNAHWIWTVDAGGEDLTALLARGMKATRQEAETLKLAPHTLEHPSKSYEQVEEKLDEWRARLVRLLEDATDQNPLFDIVGTYGSGGCPLTHQYFRRVLARP